MTDPVATQTLAYVDTECTGLDVEYHEIWEVALILETVTGGVPAVQAEVSWQLPVNGMGRADPRALSVGRFYQRRLEEPLLTHPMLFARDFTRMTHGAVLVGAVPGFDAERLFWLLRHHQGCAGWHYQTVDVETLAAGWLRGIAATNAVTGRHDRPMGADGGGRLLLPPWDSNELSRAVGVDPDRFERHTALGDARWCRAILHAVMGWPQ